MSPRELLTPLTKAWVIRWSMPVACSTAPNVMAHTINQTVFNMPFMPPLDSNSSARPWPVVTETSKAMACMEAT